MGDFSWYAGGSAQQPHLTREIKPWEPLPQAGDPWFEREEAVWLPIELVERLWEPIAMHDDWAPLYAGIDEIRELGARLRGEAA